MEEYILITGNIIDGMKFYGPFTEFGAAEDWAFENLDDYIITELTRP